MRFDEIPHPRSYGCPRARRSPALHGDPHHESWSQAPWSESFTDIEGLNHHPQPSLRTRMKMLWDDEHLYIGAEMEDLDLWATQTERDCVIFHEHDFEVFLDPDDDHHQYVELEINALNTVWDLLLPKPYRDGGPPVNAYDIHGLKTAVKLDGTLNDPSTKDKGWSVTIAIPWTALAPLSSKPVPPRRGDRWRINFSRVEWDLETAGGKYRKVEGRPEHNWVWSPQIAVDMHRPEMWGFLEFQGATSHSPNPDPYWRERCLLMEAYGRQVEYKKAHGAYSASSLGLENVEMLAYENFWLAHVRAHDGTTLSIREDSRLGISRATDTRK